MKKILKLVTFLALFVLLTNCEKEAVSLLISNSDNFLIEEYSLEKAKEIPDFIELTTKFKADKFIDGVILKKSSIETEIDFEIDFSTINKITKDSLISYTFRINRNKNVEHTFENLVIEKQNDSIRGYIMRYEDYSFVENGKNIEFKANIFKTAYQKNLDQLIIKINEIKKTEAPVWSWINVYTTRKCTEHGEFNNGNGACANYG